jgi:hypothetical protein
VHSSGGLTILEAIIRGCPVISYGFSYGHVRATEKALERFGLAEVADRPGEITPALARVLERRPEPDGSFARQPSTASMILVDERRVRRVPAWRLRAARAVAGSSAVMLLAGWTLTAGASYRLVSHFVPMRPVTAVATTRPEIGVLVEAPMTQLPRLASTLSRRGIHASFAVNGAGSAAALAALGHGDQVVPQLPNGGLVRWLGARGALHRLLHELGAGPHFLYASHGPSLGQWLVVHGSGGRMVGGAVLLDDVDDSVATLRPGEVVELAANGQTEVQTLVTRLCHVLRTDHLRAVSVGRLIRDAGPAA